MSPLVSIIIPCYNARQFIGETVQSVMMQSFTNWELIVVNDGSTDESLRILSALDDNRIHIISQTNQGVSVSRNNGAAVAKGDFIIFLDADDILSKDYINCRMEIFKNHPEINVIGSIVKVFDGSINRIIKTQVSIVDNIKRDVLLYLPQSTTTPSSYIYRKKLFDGNPKIYNPQLSSTADRFFLLEFEKEIVGMICDNPDACLFYRSNPGSMSAKLSKGLVDDNEKFYTLLRERGFLSVSDRAYLKKGYYILYRSNFRIMRPARAASYFLKWLFS